MNKFKSKLHTISKILHTHEMYDVPEWHKYPKLPIKKIETIALATGHAAALLPIARHCCCNIVNMTWIDFITKQ